MRPSTYALVALLIPLPVIAVVMAPILASAMGKPLTREDWEPTLSILLSFGVPQYAVFAPVLALLTRGRSNASLKRLALWAPVMFVPFLVAPMLGEADSVADMMSLLAVPGLIGLTVGYVCVAIALAGWPRE